MSFVQASQIGERFRDGTAFLWNCPNTLLGLLAGIGGRHTWNAEEQVWEVVGGWLVRCLARLRLADAITLGDVILYADSSLIPLLRDHERVHVRQYRAWGPLFLPAYLGESLYQCLRGRSGYHHNRFEIAAYRAKNEKEK